MEYKTRDGKIIRGNDGQDKFLKKLYSSRPGRTLVEFLIWKPISDLGGAFLGSAFSKPLIKSFVRNNGIVLSQYEEKNYSSYNDFFTRKIKEGNRPFNMDVNVLVSPCDSKLSVYPITEDGLLTIKDTKYTIKSLLRNEELAKEYEGGLALIFRLTVDDYHRYFFIDKGEVGNHVSIPGVYHTVNPVANDYFEIYKENHREYAILNSENFGKVLMMEVGALMVGKITNHNEIVVAERGMEKGFFEFGGSTIVLLLERGRVHIDNDILGNMSAGFETKVKAGEKIGSII